MWFRLFKSYYEDLEVHLDLKSKHVLYSYASVMLYGLGHISIRNLENKAIKCLS